jgi:perosamine synthetase
MIPIFRPSMGDEEVNAIAEVIKSGWIGLGPKTAEFEKNFANYLNVDHVVGVNSCTSALDLAVRLLNIKKHDEVIVPTMTFVSTGHAVAYNDAIPIFADIDPETLCIDIEDVKRKISSRTKAIIVVHFGGRAVDIDKLKEISGDIPIIEDCAHAAGAEYKGKKCGTLGALGCFSFHAVKNIAMGDGGAISINDPELAKRAYKLRWLGIDKGTWDRTGLDRSYWWEYQVDEIGLKCHMHDIAAAMGIVQLKKLDSMNQKRKKIVKRYIELLQADRQLVLPVYDDDSSWHLFFIKHGDRNGLSVYLKDNGISTGVHYKPIHMYPCYGNRPYLPVSEKVFKNILTLPLYPDLPIETVEQIANLIKDYDKN